MRSRRLGAALAAVAIAAVSLLWLRASGPRHDDPGRFDALLRDASLGLPAQWQGRPWPATRGADEDISSTARATRLGARIVDLDLAVNSRDATGSTIAAEAAALLDPMPGSAPLASLYRGISRDIAASRWPAASVLATARRSVGQLAESELVALGALLEAGRIGAARRDESFFRARATQDALARASSNPQLTRAARGALQRLRTLTTPGERLDWRGLDDQLTALLRTTGS